MASGKHELATGRLSARITELEAENDDYKLSLSTFTRQADERIRALEAQLASQNIRANERVADALKDRADMVDRAVKAEAQLAERTAQLKEVQSNWKKYEPIVGRMEKAEGQLAIATDNARCLADRLLNQATELEAENARLRAALTTIRDWPFDVRGDCVADARKLAQAALRLDGEVKSE